METKINQSGPQNTNLVSVTLPPVTKFIRYESKYLLDRKHYEHFMVALKQHVEKEVYNSCATKEPTPKLVSMYWDSPYLSFFWDGFFREPRRMKIRIRKYDVYSNICFLELKSKEFGLSKKYRLQLHESWIPKIFCDLPGTAPIDPTSFYHSTTYAQLADAIREMNPSVPAKQLTYTLHQTISAHYSRHLNPVMQVAVQRTAYINKDLNNLRVTVDKNLCYRQKERYEWTVKSSDMLPLVETQARYIIEIKYTNIMPTVIADIVRDLGLKRAAFSKYTHAMAEAEFPVHNKKKSIFKRPV